MLHWNLTHHEEFKGQFVNDVMMRLQNEYKPIMVHGVPQVDADTSYLAEVWYSFHSRATIIMFYEKPDFYTEEDWYTNTIL